MTQIALKQPLALASFLTHQNAFGERWIDGDGVDGIQSRNVNQFLRLHVVRYKTGCGSWKFDVNGLSGDVSMEVTCDMQVFIY